MAERPTWIRPVLSIFLFVGLGAFVLAGAAWLAVKVLPDGEEVADDHDVETSVIETGLATVDQFVAEVDRCEVVDGLVEVGGWLQNTSGADQAFVVHVAVLFGDVLFDGLTTDIGVPEVADGDDTTWADNAGTVDPADTDGVTPTCEIDRVGLGEQLVD